MRPDPLPPPLKKGTNGPLLIHSRLLYSNLLATSIFIETPEVAIEIWPISCQNDLETQEGTKE